MSMWTSPTKRRVGRVPHRDGVKNDELGLTLNPRIASRTTRTGCLGHQFFVGALFGDLAWSSTTMRSASRTVFNLWATAARSSLRQRPVAR